MRRLQLLLQALLLVPCTAQADNATNFTCQELPPWGEPVGIVIGSIASIGINIGQNMQADGLRSLPDDLRDSKPWRSRVWTIGQVVFVTFSMANFAALALAPASVRGPSWCLDPSSILSAPATASASAATAAAQ